MEILLSKSDLILLLDHLSQSELAEYLEKEKHKGEYLANGEYATGKYCLELTGEQIEIIQEELLILLTKKGMGVDGELNEIGFYIERVVDFLEDGLIKSE